MPITVTYESGATVQYHWTRHESNPEADYVRLSGVWNVALREGLQVVDVRVG